MQLTKTSCTRHALSALPAVLLLFAVGATQADIIIPIENAGFQDTRVSSSDSTFKAVPDNNFTDGFGSTTLKDDSTTIYVPAWRPADNDNNVGSGVHNSVAGTSDFYSGDTTVDGGGPSENQVAVVFGQDMFNDLDTSYTLQTATYTLSALVGDRTNTGFNSGVNLVLQAGGTTLDETQTGISLTLVNPTPGNGAVVTWSDTITVDASSPLIGQTLTVGVISNGGGPVARRCSTILNSPAPSPSRRRYCCSASAGWRC